MTCSVIIAALDPAGVGFKESEYKEGLPETFVDVIHTTSGILGLREKVGDIDFYPNGGVSPQPGCNVLDQVRISLPRTFHHNFGEEF